MTKKAWTSILSSRPHFPTVLSAPTIRSEGYNVPEDIAVVGYDDYSDNRMDDVALTTYHVNIEEMIGQLLNILEQHCVNPDYRYGTVISYGWLVERKTGLLGAGKNKGE